MTRLPHDKRHLPFGNSAAIMDDDTLSVLDQVDLSSALARDTVAEYCATYRDWILSSKGNTITGLEQFPYACYSNGTTESFDKFYIKNRTRRFRCFRGEYMYHQLMWRNSWPDWFWLDDACLDPNDAVVISLPFSDTGKEHHLHQALLDGCDELGIPVLVDCAYFGICSDINFDFTHKCITDVVFSLSKTFPIAHARAGIRFTRTDDDDSLFVCNKAGYVNRIGCAIGLAYMKQFSPDYIVDKYKQTQLTLCNKLSVEVSNTVLFGIGGEKWQEYNRGCATNRLSFHKMLHLTPEQINDLHW